MIEHYDDNQDRGNPLEAELSEATNEYREQAVLLFDFLKRWCSAIKEFKGRRAFAFDCGLLALGFTDILGCDSQSSLADKWRCKKENVRKLVSHIQHLTGAPPTLSQRSVDGKNNMSEARRKQLKTT